MRGIQIVFVQALPSLPEVTESENGKLYSREIYKADGVSGSIFSPQPPLVPHVFVDGRPFEMLRSASIKASADQPVPTLIMERYLFSPDDEVLTLTPEEYARWNLEREFRLFTEFVAGLPSSLQVVTVKEEVITPEVTLVDVCCTNRGMRFDKKLFEVFKEKFLHGIEIKVVS